MCIHDEATEQATGTYQVRDDSIEPATYRRSHDQDIKRNTRESRQLLVL